MLNAQHPVVIFANGLGDHLLSLPALRALAMLYPERLTLICKSGARQRFFSNLSLHAVCETDMRLEAEGRVFDAEAVARYVEGCDLLLSLNPWHSHAVDHLLELLTPTKSIGFFPAFQISLPLDYSKHAADLVFDVPLQLDSSLRLEEFAAPPVIAAEYRQQAQALRNEVPPTMRVMVVHADTKAAKMWHPTCFVELLDLFLSRHPEFVVFVVGIQNLMLDVGRHGERVIPCYRLPLAVSLSLVAEADLFVGVDSCMLHAADLFRVPGVGLFGPTNCVEWGFRLTRHRHVCGVGTMGTIHEEEVLESIESLLTNAD